MTRERYWETPLKRAREMSERGIAVDDATALLIDDAPEHDMMGGEAEPKEGADDAARDPSSERANDA